MCVQYNPYSNRLSVKMAVPNARFIRQQMSSADITPANFAAMLEEDNEMDYDQEYYDDMDFDDQDDEEYDDYDDDDEDYDDFRRRLNIDDFYDLDDDEYDDRDQGKVFCILFFVYIQAYE